MSARAVEDAHSKLRRMERFVAAHFDDELAKVGLKATQLGLLSEVIRLQPVCPGELARALSIDPSTLTRNMKPLLAAGWIEVGPGSDARSRSTRITHAGHAKQSKAQQRLFTAQRSIEEKLGPRRMAELEKLIHESLDILTAS